ncbi:DUF2971 domain-containing protein [Marinomonas polaris]|uniref:DUF2971 domain-containing protein n=1 Tax=Marinomonas polaris TaxID=293552 RepID=UPI003F94F13C
MSLFKYYAPDSFDFICVEGGVSARFSQPSVLNDVFEFNGALPQNGLLNRTKNLLKFCEIDLNDISDRSLTIISKSLEAHHIEELQRQFKKFGDIFIGVFSLSKIKHSRSMWSYYGKDHSGFMIEFQTNEDYQPIFTLKDDRYSCGFVEYTKERHLNMLFFFRELNDMEEKEADRLSDIVAFSKDYQWSHEEEYRVVRSVSNIPPSGLDSDGHKIHALTIPNIQIKSITLGVRANDILERKARFWIETQSQSTKLYRAEPCAMEYKFNSIEIPI